MNRSHFPAPIIASTVLLLSGLWSGATLAEVGDKRAKCAEGIGCSDASPPKSPPAKKPETQTPRTDPQPERSTSNDGAGRIRQDSSTTRAQSDVRQRVEECSNRQQQSVDYHIGARQRISNPALNASQCIRLGDRKGLYGPGFVNTCQHPVQFKFCAYRSRPGSWEEAFDCEKTKGGTELIQPGQSIAAHTSNAEHFYWAGCKFPEGTPADFKFTAGRGYEFRCYAWSDTTEQAARSWQTAECNTTELVKKAEKRLADEKAVAAAQAAARQKATEQKESALRKANEKLAQQRASLQQPFQLPKATPPTPLRYDSPNPTANQLIAVCQAEWMAATNDGYFDESGWAAGYTVLKSSTHDLLNLPVDQWLDKQFPWCSGGNRHLVCDRTKVRPMVACFIRETLNGRAGRFRTPSLTVRTWIDNNTAGRQDY